MSELEDYFRENWYPLCWIFGPILIIILVLVCFCCFYRPEPRGEREQNEDEHSDVIVSYFV